MPIAQAKYDSPGVYRSKVSVAPQPVLETAVPGFVGFAGAGNGINFNQPVRLTHKNQLAAFATAGDAGSPRYLMDAVTGFFDNGGVRCYIVPVDPGQQQIDGLIKAIDALAPLDDIDLVAVPDAVALRTEAQAIDKDGILRVQGEVLSHCARQANRFAILDSFPGAGVEEVKTQAKLLVLGQREPLNGALYFPWLWVAKAAPSPAQTTPAATPSRTQPPCGHVAGIYRRSDDNIGVFKAPANEELFGVLDLESQIDNHVQGDLNSARVNCLRAFPGRGIRVWGARTLGSASAAGDPWAYVNVRRLFLTVRRWIDLNMGWVTFEPNDARLWIRIQRELTAYLGRLQSRGALQGNTPAEAFYVKCDAENNPPDQQGEGRVVVEIGLAPLSPAEFIFVEIVLSAAGASTN